MKTNITYYLYVLLIVANACNSGAKTQNNTKDTYKLVTPGSLTYEGHDSVIQIKADQIEPITYTKFSKKTQNIKYISLKTPDPIGIIDKIIIYKNKIYVLDSRKAECIFIFDMTGNLLKILNDKGRGPTEYLGLEDMNIDKTRQELVINDRLLGGLLHFTLDGKFIKKSKSCPKSDFVINDSVVISHIIPNLSDKGDFLVAVSREDSILLKDFPINPLNKHQGRSRIFFTNFCNQVLCIPPSSDTIYYFTSDSTYEAKYVLNHPKSIWEYKDLELTSEEYNNLLKSGYSSRYGSFLELDSMIYFSMETSEKGVLLIKSYFYDKGKEIAYEVIENKIDINGIFPHKPVAIYENAICGIVEPFFFKAIKNALDTCQSFPEKIILNTEIKDVLKHWEMESDPVLVLYEFK